MNAKEPEAAKLKALQEAACMGWADIAAGRHADVADGQLEGFIAQLGQQAALAVATRREAIPRGWLGQPAFPARTNRAQADCGLLTDGLPIGADAGDSFPYRESSPMAYEPLQLNLGSLRSAMSLTLHTHHASRIWHGRAPSEGRAGIIGLNGFISAMNKMKRGAEQDDPYSDFWMLRIEDKLEQTKSTLQALREQVDQALADVPPALSLGENMNVQPVKLPLFVNAQLGFMAVYLLADYDDLARKLILAHHTALIDRSTLERWLNDGAHALRSLFSLAQQYRYSGTTRDDFAAKNAAARAALEKFGELPQDVLEGTRRSRFAPPIARRANQPGAPAAAPAADAVKLAPKDGAADGAPDEDAAA